MMLLLVGAVLIGGTAVAGRMARRLTRPDWIATTAKYVGLILASGLGLVGTATDTKEKTSDGRYKMRKAGWIVAMAIMASLVAGALGQYFEDHAKQAAEQKQILRLEAITQLAKRSLARYSGKLEGEVEFSIPADQPQIHAISINYEKIYPQAQDLMKDLQRAFPDSVTGRSIERSYQKEFRHLVCRVTIGPVRPRERNTAEVMTFELAPRSDDDVHVVEFDHQKRLVRAMVQMKAANIENFGVFSAADFGKKLMTVTYYDMETGIPDGRGNRRVRGRMLADVTRVTLIDGELATVLTRAKLTRKSWPAGGDGANGDDEGPADYVGVTRAVLQ